MNDLPARETLTIGQQLASYGTVTWIWVLGLSMLGGISSFVSKVRKGHARWFNLVELLGECAISAFVGIVTFLLTDGHVPPAAQAAMVAISGHMGTRAIFLFEQVFTRRLAGGVPVTGEPAPTDPG